MLCLGLLLTGCAVTDGHYGGGGWELLGERVLNSKLTEIESKSVDAKEGSVHFGSL
jgi:hypothetical protein